MFYEVFDYLVSEFVDYDIIGNLIFVIVGKGIRNIVIDWMKNFKFYNVLLQEIFNELNFVDFVKICEFYKFFNVYKSCLSFDVFIFNFI